MTDHNQFQFSSSGHLPGVTLLHADMDDFHYDRHAHEEHAFGITLTGMQEFFSGGHHHRSHPGQIILFNPEEVHDGNSGGEVPLSYQMLYVPPETLGPLVASVSGKTVRHPEQCRFRASDTLLWDEPLRQHLQTLGQMIQRGQGSQIEQEQQLLGIAERLAQREGSVAESTQRPRTDRLLRRAKDFIQAHMHEDINLDAISAAANLSKYHFLRLFRQQFGITPHQYVLNCRINAARSALATGGKLEEVALQHGFTDLSHFNRRFKRIYGMTPRQYQSCLQHSA